MGSAIGDLLPLAVGIAISPVPMIAAILMLLSPKAKVTSIAFLLGWVIGIALTLTVFTLLSSVLPQTDANAAKPVTAVIQLVLALGLLFLAFRQWRARPAPGTDPPLPKWMSAIDSMTAMRAFLLALLLAAVNPKNLLLGAAAGLSLGQAGLASGEIVLVGVIFVLIAAVSVLVPVVSYLVASKAMAGTLEALRAWLVHNNATVMAVLLFVLGVVLLGKSLGNF